MHHLWKKLTAWIDRKPTKVKFSTRVIAYIIDWVIGGIISGLPAVFIYAGVTGRSDMFSDLYVFPALGFSVAWSYLAGCLCVIFGLIYYVYIPYKKYPGQTLGKRWMKLKMIKADGTDIDLKTLLIRQGIGLMLLESGAIVVSTYIRQMLTLLTGIYLEYYIIAVGSFLTIISAVIVFNTPSARSIHDYLAKTRVVLESENFNQISTIQKNKPRHKRRHK